MSISLARVSGASSPNDVTESVIKIFTRSKLRSGRTRTGGVVFMSLLPLFSLKVYVSRPLLATASSYMTSYVQPLAILHSCAYC
jgi:hypothetical protein